MRKKSWGRLGATVSAVALLAGGLMGVAGPAQADGLYWTENAAYKLHMDNGLDGNPNIIMLWDSVAAPGGQIPDVWPPEYYHEFVLAECVEAAERYAADKYPGFVKTKSLQRSGAGCDLWIAASVPEPPTAQECEDNGQVLNQEGTACRDKTEQECLADGLGFDPVEQECVEVEIPDRPITEGCPESLTPTVDGCLEILTGTGDGVFECEPGLVLTEDGCKEQIISGDGVFECEPGLVLTEEGCKEQIIVGNPGYQCPVGEVLIGGWVRGAG